MTPLPYCGAAPLPGALLSRLNLDLVLIVALIAFASVQYLRSPYGRIRGLLGWAAAAAALLSPLCALSVSLFSARVAQHMVLVLIAAPLIASGLAPRIRPASWALWGSGAVFFLALWLWHLPVPYEATFISTPLYWTMHVSLFGSAICLWYGLLHHARERTIAALAVGLLTSIQMGLLGALLCLADHPLFRSHLATASAWGLSPLEDQQLGGIFMWVPGIALFLMVALRSMTRFSEVTDRVRAA